MPAVQFSPCSTSVLSVGPSVASAGCQRHAESITANDSQLPAATGGHDTDLLMTNPPEPNVTVTSPGEAPGGVDWFSNCGAMYFVGSPSATAAVP